MALGNLYAVVFVRCFSHVHRFSDINCVWACTAVVWTSSLPLSSSSFDWVVSFEQFVTMKREQYECCFHRFWLWRAQSNVCFSIYYEAAAVSWCNARRYVRLVRNLDKWDYLNPHRNWIAVNVAQYFEIDILLGHFKCDKRSYIALVYFFSVSLDFCSIELEHFQSKI